MNHSSRSILVLLIALAIAAIAVPVSARAAGVNTFKLSAVTVTGTDRYTEKEILPASGMQLGQTVGEADFKEAVRRLGDTGLFTGVAYTFTYSPAGGARLELQLTDTDKSKLLPANFENFVWFTDSELLQSLRKRVPLFKNVLPETGSLPDTVERALQDMLDEKQIPARVDYLREAPLDGGPLLAFAYRVEAMDIRIRNVEFPGATPDQLPALQAAARKLAGASFMRSSLALVAFHDYLPVCLQRGYLKASFANAEARVVSTDGSDVEVDAVFPLTPGKIYATAALDWQGNTVIPAEKLQATLHLPVGKPADAVLLVTDLENVVKLYHTKGYMIATVDSKANLDDDKAVVRYEIKVTEGEQFKMGDLEIQGLDSQTRAQLEAAWKLNEGDPFNQEYATKFLAETATLLPARINWSREIREAVNERDKTVDVTIRFVAR